MNASAMQRLRALPAVFSLTMLASRLNGDRGRASIYVRRWKEAGLVLGAGPRLGIYFNLAVDPQAASMRALEAVKLAFPEAVICGETVLHDEGWTTQIPQSTQLIVLEARTLPQVYGFELHGRPASWFVEFANEIDQEGFARLSPRAALVDAWKYHGYKGDVMWRPDPDDLESDEVDWDGLVRLFGAHNTPFPDIYADHDSDRSLARYPGER